MAKAKDPAIYYPLLITAFREEPGNINRAARVASVTWNTAERAWERGNKKAGLGPIKDLIRAEQERARALIEADRKAAIAARLEEDRKSKDQAIQARKQEGQMTSLVRASTLQALAAVATLAKEARGLAESINKQVAIEREKLDQWTVYETALISGDPNAQNLRPAWAPKSYDGYPYSIATLLNMLNRSADYAGKITDCGRKAMEMERLYLGEPMATISIVDERREITLEEVDVRTENALAAINRGRAAGGLTLLPGGRAEPRVGQRVIVR